jgi:hypothetical protein
VSAKAFPNRLEMIFDFSKPDLAIAAQAKCSFECAY